MSKHEKSDHFVTFRHLVVWDHLVPNRAEARQGRISIKTKKNKTGQNLKK